MVDSTEVADITEVADSRGAAPESRETADSEVLNVPVPAAAPDLQAEPLNP